jgi:exonuclease III
LAKIVDTHGNTIDLDIHLQQLQQFSNHTSIIHLNTQSMCSTFDEFYVMCSTYQHDIITLLETWLKENHHLIEHVQMPGYKLDYRKSNGKRGGGIGVYRVSQKKRYGNSTGCCASQT